MATGAVRTVPRRVIEILNGARQLAPVERLTLANLLLESVLVEELDQETDWMAMSLDSFQKDWDNPEDAIYDDWRDHYGVPAR